MKVYASRHSVSAGDDVDAPHGREFSLGEGLPLKDVIAAIQSSSYLPQIIGGQASWSVTSNIPIAVVAQQWAAPKMLLLVEDMRDLDVRDGRLRLHFNYHAQIDPDTVYRVFWGFDLKAT